jgi:uncharacterized membrane protein YphA (DoxX/SURF4 family)
VIKSSANKFALLRIAFGLVWAIDAFFKWNPAFISMFKETVGEGISNQPQLIQEWIKLWLNVISVNPHLFAILTAISETIIALGLIFGVATRYVIYFGIIFSLLIWSTAEGFGGPYQEGSTDVGTGIIYVFVFVALLLGKAWQAYSWDARKK